MSNSMTLFDHGTHETKYPTIELYPDMEVRVTATRQEWANLLIGTMEHLKEGVVEELTGPVPTQLIMDAWGAAGEYVRKNDLLNAPWDADLSVPMKVGQCAALYAYWGTVLRRPEYVDALVPPPAVKMLRSMLDSLFDAREEAAKQLAEAEQ